VALSQQPVGRATSPVMMMMRIQTQSMVISLALRSGWCRRSW